MRAAPRPSQAGLRGLKFGGLRNRLFNPNQTRKPPSRMKMNSVIIRNVLAGFSMLALGRSGLFDPHGFQFDGLLWLVVCSAWQFRNFSCDIHSFDNLAEDGVLVIEPGRRRHGDEKLAPVCAGSGVGHRELSRFVVLQGRMKFVGEAISWICILYPSNAAEE